MGMTEYEKKLIQRKIGAFLGEKRETLPQDEPYGLASHRDYTLTVASAVKFVKNYGNLHPLNPELAIIE